MSDGEIFFAQWLLIIGALVVGCLIGSRDRHLPPPDPKARRSRCEY